MTASRAPSTLPALTPEEAEHSRLVTAFIRERIKAAGGWLPFDAFMDLALYAPGLGYYSAGSTKIGRGGDFTTAPEVSDLFSRCVGRQCSEVLEKGGGSILELGAGTGRLAAAVLAELSAIGTVPKQYFILEVSADLRERQRERVSQLPAALRDRVVWLDALPSQPFRGVILANEVLDALPCERVVVRDGQVRALGVGVAPASDATGVGAGAASEFVECEGVASAEVAKTWADIAAALLQGGGVRDGGLQSGLAEGYRTELCTRIGPWIAGLSECLASGLILLFDYGLPRVHYYHPQRTDGTLRCHFKQRAHDDPFINVGVQDITAWVDFTRVAEAADAAGLQVSGFATQAAFLLGLGIEEMVNDPDIARHAKLAGEARKLLMPGEMGEAFKAMALTRDFDDALSGFAVQDLRHSL
jgi:SAM-dependent MidA family methyltransferase